MTTGNEKPPLHGAEPATILVVEDSQVQAELLRRELENAGYRVMVASNGAEGLAMAKAHHPAAVVSDINMPVMDGYAMCHAMRHEQTLRTTPVILLTMLADPEDVIRGLQAGADAYMTKPYNVPALVSRIESLLFNPPDPPPELERRTVAIRLAGETHTVDAHGPRILTLLISTYENAVLQNRELAATQHALEDLNLHLEQKVAEKTAALQNSERRFRSLLEQGSDLVTVVDANGRIAYVSPSIKRLGGYEVDEVLGGLFLDYAHPEDRPAAEAEFTGILRKPNKLQTSEFRFRAKDGAWATLESIARNALDDQAVQGIIINSRDISERKRAIAALATSETKYRRLFEAARDGILILDAQGGQIVDVNPFMIELLGYTREQYLGRKLWEIGPFKDTAATMAAFAELQTNRYVRYEELPLRTADGRDIDVEFVSHVYAVNGGEVVQCNIRDITERKRAEDELKRLNWALRALGQSNSALVHVETEKELFQSCCDAIAGTEGYPLAWIGLAMDDPAHSITIAAAAGEALEYVHDFEVSWGDTPQGRGPTGAAIRTGATQVTNNLEESSACSPWIERTRAHGLASSISLPIRADGAVIGALAIYGREPDAFGRPEVGLFEELAADIGYGIAARRTRVAYEAGLVEREQGTRKLRAAFESLIAVLAATVEVRDPYTAGHQRRVAELAAAIGRALGLDAARIEGLHFASTIHDIGKIYVPAEILARPGKLGAPEFDLVKAHAQVGFEILKGVDFPWQVADMIHQHHERQDGSGYPQGLKGEQILLESRILAVADVVEAMSSHRPYRAGLGLDAALAQIRREAGTRLDTQVVDACERVFHQQGFAFGKA